MAEERRKYNRKPTLLSEQLNDIGGKMPPQALELEEAVLGAVMLEKDAIIRVIDFLKPEYFYKEAHERIFRGILTLFGKSDPIDILTVTQHLKTTAELDLVGGAYYITKLTNSIASSQNVETHARIIQQMAVKRKNIQFGSEMVKNGYDQEADIFEMLGTSLTNINSLMTGLMRKTEQGSAKMFAAFLKQLDIVAQSEDAITGVPTELTEVNSITRGFQKTDLIIIAGRPGSGKTASLKPIIKGAIKNKRPVLLFSLEMSTAQNISRLMSEDTGTPSNAFNSKEFMSITDFGKLNAATSKYFDEKGKDLLIIDDTASLSINELSARAKLICSKHDIQIILVDYLQMITGQGENKVNEIEDVCKGLKQLAKDLNLPIVALSQLNRDVEKRSPPIPQLSDLRSSGAIEQYADLVIFLYRPEYYKIQELEDGSTSRHVAYWIIAKNRNGGLIDIKLKFIDMLTKFEDWSESSSFSSYTDYSQPRTEKASAGMEPSTDFGNIVTKPDKFKESPF